MPDYDNGRVPSDLLVTFASGWNSAEGTWHHMLTPATLAKHRALVKLAKANTGRDISITEGWGAYRPYDSQVYARRLYGFGAAVPGTSSHGMFWEGRQCAAIDYNWGDAYGWDRDAWFRDVRAVGLTPGLIHPSRGDYPDEPWHVVDLYPWAAVPAGFNTSEEEDDMTPEQAKQLDKVTKQVSAVYAALFGARNVTGKETPVSWVNFKGDAQSSNYGLLPIAIHNQTLIAQQSARIAELEAKLEKKD
jgi:hypothetical protein